MNKYILIHSTPGSEERSRQVVNAAIPGGVSALYTYLYKPNGMAGSTTPVTAAWWSDDASSDSLLLLLDWNVETSELSSKMSHLAQSIVAKGDSDFVLAQHLYQQGYTEAHHRQVLEAADLLRAISNTGMLISHVYTTQTGSGYGTMIGIQLRETGRKWLVASITQEPSA